MSQEYILIDTQQKVLLKDKHNSGQHYEQKYKIDISKLQFCHFKY